MAQPTLSPETFIARTTQVLDRMSLSKELGLFEDVAPPDQENEPLSVALPPRSVSWMTDERMQVRTRISGVAEVPLTILTVSLVSEPTEARMLVTAWDLAALEAARLLKLLQPLSQSFHSIITSGSVSLLALAALRDEHQRRETTKTARFVMTPLTFVRLANAYKNEVDIETDRSRLRMGIVGRVLGTPIVTTRERPELLDGWVYAVSNELGVYRRTPPRIVEGPAGRSVQVRYAAVLFGDHSAARLET